MVLSVPADQTDALAKSVLRLVRATEGDGTTRITLPMMYPSGAPIQVQINLQSDTCFITDCGNAYQEAELMGASARTFNGQARDVAKYYGIQFNNHSFFAVSVPIPKIEGAIAAIGSASLRSIVLTEAKMAEGKEQSARDELKYHLREVFGRQSVVEDFEMFGSSSHKWKFAGRVITVKGPALFDAVTPVASSVYAANSKFGDIASLENPPLRISAVADHANLPADYKNLLQQASSIIPLSSPATVYHTAAGIAA